MEKGLAKVNGKIINRGLKYSGVKGYTLDIDATGIEAQKQAFRLIVIRQPIQKKLFDEKEKYTVIATNLTEDIEQVVRWYNQRGQCSENMIKELKIGFGMKRMPFKMG